MKIERNSATENAKTTTQYRLNGKSVGFWRVLPGILLAFTIFAIAGAVIGPVVLIILGYAVIMIAMALFFVALAFIPAGIHRLITGKWPSWFQVEYSRSTTEE